MKTRKIITSLAVTAAVLLTSVVAVTASHATVADHRKCVTAYELRHTVKGLTAKQAFALLDGPGRARTASSRTYTRCEYRATVIVVFDRSLRTRGARVLRAVQVIPPKPKTVYTQVSTPAEIAVDCNVLLSTWIDQKRTSHWVFNKRIWRWVLVWGPWVTVRTYTQPATTQDTVRANSFPECNTVVSLPPADALLPDLRIKSLDKCGAGDMAYTNGSCFIIDTTTSPGRKLLRFPIITLNVGAGPAELVATRGATSDTTWTTRQTLSRTNGTTVDLSRPDHAFTFIPAHNHWHSGLDAYWIEALTGTPAPQVLARGNDHGYCPQDNTSLASFPNLPSPFYLPSTSCGYGQPNALSLTEGFSQGWGDTYEASSPEQYIDVTGLPDGTYRVGVTANSANLFAESNVDNNTATIEITISGNTVTTNPATATGGL